MMVSNICLTILDESTFKWFFNKNLVRHNGWTKSKTAVLISVDFDVERAAQYGFNRASRANGLITQ
jgi:hypothetical protein